MKFCDMEEEEYQEFDWSTPDENPMYETGKGAELTEIKFEGTFDEVRKQSQKILRLTGSKMSFNHDATALGVDDGMLSSVGTMAPKNGADEDETVNLRESLLQEIEWFRRSGDGFGRVLDLSPRDGLPVCKHVRVQEHVDPKADIGVCECGATISSLVDDKTQQYDTMISFCGLQTYQRCEQRKILLDIKRLSKSLLVVQGPLKDGDVDVSIEINFLIPGVKMVTVGRFFLWYYDQYTLRPEIDMSDREQQEALSTGSGEKLLAEGYEFKRVVLVGIDHYKCLGIVDTVQNVERCMVDVGLMHLETIPEALSRGLAEIGCSDLSCSFLGIVHPREGGSELFVFGTYDVRVKQRDYVKLTTPSQHVARIDRARFKTGHLLKVINLLVHMKVFRYNLKILNQYKTYIYRLKDGRKAERSFSEEWGYHKNSGLISVHLVEEVAENDVICCFGKLIQRYKPGKINLRSGNLLIGKAYRLADNLYKVGHVEGEQYERGWCNPSRPVVVVPMNDEFYRMAGDYLGLSDYDVKKEFLLLRGVAGDNCQKFRSLGECVFKKGPGNFEATEELFRELMRRSVITKYDLMLKGNYSADNR